MPALPIRITIGIGRRCEFGSVVIVRPDEESAFAMFYRVFGLLDVAEREGSTLTVEHMTTIEVKGVPAINQWEMLRTYTWEDIKNRL